MMKFIETSLNGAFIVEVDPFQDSRGLFERVFCKKEFAGINGRKDVIQINHSLTRKRESIRGLHFQSPPRAETKMVRCISGSVYDVIVDVRTDSTTFLQWYGVTLSALNRKMIYIPEGLAHGFQTLEDDCELLYLHTEYYSREHESGIRYDDPLVGIEWIADAAEISEKDQKIPLIDGSFKGVVI